jgi:Fe-S-cluster-containing hydrogenase component 2
MTEDDRGGVHFDSQKCFGCGLCVTTCPTGSLILERKPDDRLMLPVDDHFFDSQERMAVERMEVERMRKAVGLE